MVVTMFKDITKEILKPLVPFAKIGEFNFNLNSTYLIYSLEKAGKTSLGLYLSDCAIKKNLKVLYIDSEKKIRVVPTSILKKRIALNNEIYSKFFTLIEMDSNITIESMENELQKYDIIVIDSITKLLESCNRKAKGTRGREIMDFLNTFGKENNKTIIILSQAHLPSNWSLPHKGKPVQYGGSSLHFYSDESILISDIKSRDGKRVIFFERATTESYFFIKDGDISFTPFKKRKK